MPITVRIPPPLRRYTAGAETAEFSARNLSELFERLEQSFPGIKPAICAPDGTPLRFINIYVNDEDIRFLGGPQYTFKDGDEVLLIPAIAGGAPGRAGAVLPARLGGCNRRRGTALPDGLGAGADPDRSGRN